METHYEVLNVSRDATNMEIRDAYEFQQMQCLPGSDTAKRISAAYLTLSDPDRRREYDEALSGAPKESRQPFGREPGAAVFTADLSEHPGTWAEAAYVASPQHKRQPDDVRVSEPAPYDAELWKRAWRGEYPLWVTFWLFGVLAGALLMITSGMIFLPADPNDSQRLIRALVTLLFLAMGWYLYSAVAVWRSARKPGPRAFWKRAAKTSVLAPPVIVALWMLAITLVPGLFDSPRHASHESGQVPTEVYRGYSETTIPPSAPHAPPAATFTIDADLEQAAAYAVERYPFLDGNSPLVNHAAIDEVVALRDRFYSEGYSIGTALRMAVEVVGPRYAEQSDPRR